MHADDASEAARVVREFAARLAKDPHLAAELQRARREFFPGGTAGSATLPGAADAAELRFAEWFTLERDSEVLGAVPVEVPSWSGDAADLADSTAGLWLVQTASGRAVVARDLQDGASIDLEVPVASLQPGDLVVGRLFAEGAGRWAPSTAAAIFRPGAELAQAFLRDLQRLGLERRLRQIELEHLLLRRPQPPVGAPATAPAAVVPAEPGVPLEHLEADLDGLLQRASGAHTAAAISQQLAIAVRPGQVMGPLLDELAFETDVDLDRARELLLAIWNAHHGSSWIGEAGAVDAAAPPSETLGERLVRTLDEGLAQKRDLAELFSQLERMAGIDPELEPDPLGADDDDVDEDDDDDDARERAARPSRRRAGDDETFAPRRAFADGGDGDGDGDQAPAGADVAGNVAPLVEEYLWETGRGDGDAAASLRLFAELQQNAAHPHADLEQTSAVDVMRLLLHVYLGAAPPHRAARVRAAFGELREFCRWADEVQEMEVARVLDGCRGALLDQLDRLQAAGEALTTQGGAGSRPGVLQVEDIGPRGFGVRDDDGTDHWLAASPAALAQLRVGDLVLGALAPVAAAAAAPSRGARRALAGMVVVLPADAKSLME
jgi:hypothetical protein